MVPEFTYYKAYSGEGCLVKKQRFSESPEQELEKTSHKDTEKIIAHYQELFHRGLEQGRTEEEIVASLGTPQAIARYHNAHHDQPR